MVAREAEPKLLWVHPSQLTPNAWNPNRMDPAMYDKAIASITEFGFVDPITARPFGDDMFEIIDGEHRWRAALDMDLDTVPVIDLGDIDDVAAKQLTIVLNETRGQSDPDRLGTLLRDLSTRVDMDRLLTTLPYTREAFDRLAGLSQIDWSSLTRPPVNQAPGRASSWVERIYRMPPEAAGTLDRAIARIRDDDERIPDWKALEVLASEYLGS